MSRDLSTEIGQFSYTLLVTTRAEPFVSAVMGRDGIAKINISTL